MPLDIDHPITELAMKKRPTTSVNVGVVHSATPETTAIVNPSTNANVNVEKEKTMTDKILTTADAPDAAIDAVVVHGNYTIAKDPELGKNADLQKETPITSIFEGVSQQPSFHDLNDPQEGAVRDSVFSRYPLQRSADLIGDQAIDVALANKIAVLTWSLQLTKEIRSGLANGEITTTCHSSGMAHYNSMVYHTDILNDLVELFNELSFTQMPGDKKYRFFQSVLFPGVTFSQDNIPDKKADGTLLELVAEIQEVLGTMGSVPAVLDDLRQWCERRPIFAAALTVYAGVDRHKIVLPSYHLKDQAIFQRPDAESY